MNRVKIAAGSFAAGAALMYFYDPNRGKRRRAGLRDKTIKTYTAFTDELDKAGRDFANRTQGLVAGAKAVASRPDRSVLCERVKSRIGRVVSHPHAIHVTNQDGVITLNGPILESEVDDLLRTARSVSGVTGVRNQLEVHQNADHISSLQGGVPRQARAEWNQQNWTPSLRFAAGGLGSALLMRGLMRNGILGLASRLAGTALLVRATSNREFRELIGVGCDAHLIELDKTIHIDAPVAQVFSFWTNYENFPRFMRHVKQVSDRGEGRSHWVAQGPGGVRVSWDAEITRSVPNQLLAWRSVTGSQIETEGVVRFDDNENRGTRVTIRLSYRPPAGVLGHLIASLFGSDPKSEMDADMVRLKSLLEIGKIRAHGLGITLHDLMGSAAGSATS
jgi:uncharacterized membrane protein